MQPLRASPGNRRDTEDSEPGTSEFNGLDLDLNAVPASVLWTSLAINLLGLALPLVALQIYDRIIPNVATATLAILVLGLFGVVVLDTAMKVARSYLLGWEAAKFGCVEHIKATRTFLHAPMDMVTTERPTTWMDRLDALAEINAASSIPARIILIDILFVPVYVALFVMVGGILLLAPIMIIVPFVLVIIQQSKTLRQSLNDRAEQDQHKQDFLVESLNGIQAIKSMAMEPQIQRRYERLQRRSAELNYAIISQSQTLQSFGTLTSALATVAIVSCGALLIIGGSQLSVGALACCSLLSGRLMQPLMKAVSVWSDHQSRAVSHQRAAPLKLLTARAGNTGKRGEITPKCHGNIQFSGVGYVAPGKKHASLQGVSIDITAGETVAFRPGDNTTKTAFFNLVRGQIYPTQGVVTVDGRPTQTGWGRTLDPNIAMVSNTTEVISGTILENLTMFGSTGDIDRVRHFSRIIGLEAAINLLPEGYDTKIGNAVSHQLSIGLIQQIAIVRALAKRPAILIFDEAYASLDSQSDQAVIRCLRQIKGRQTLILAAHRPSYLSLADRQFDLGNGHVTPVQNAANPAAGGSAPGAQTAGRVAR